MSNITDLSPEQLRQAASIKEQIVRLEQQLQSILGGNGTVKTAGRKTGRRGPSPEAIERIRAAQKARWARFHAQRGTAKKSARGGKRKLSADAIERIRAAQRARWARVKAGKGK